MAAGDQRRTDRTASGMTRIGPGDLIKMRLRGAAEVRALADPLVIEVPRLAAAPYPDVADAILALQGRKAWSWQDACGETRDGRGLLAAAAGLGGDALALPFQLATHLARARRCAGLGRRPRRARPERGGLYLRMDHLFDLASGGSVAHTAGVINALRALVPSLSVVSTDRLAMVEPDQNFHIVTPRYRAGRNVPLVPTLTYSSEVVRWWLESGLPCPGFIYGRYSTGNYAGPELSRRLGVPYVCEYNGSALWIARNWDGKPLRFERVFRAVEDANLLGADLIVAVSEASKSELVERGYPAGRILVNPNGVDPEVYRPDLPAGPVRERLGIGHDEIVIGFIGTFGRWHGAEVLADAFGRLLARRPELRPALRLLLIGDGMTMPETRAALEQRGAINRAVLTGVISQADGPDFLAACDILASPHVPNRDASRFFGSPTKLFEYMAMGRAIVASDLEQIGELMEHERTALLVPPGDADALAAALERVATSAGLRRRLGQASRAVAVERYSWLEHTRRILVRLVADTGPDGRA
jgi:glycosyltransferase involved in cell wall biosynthesis